MCERATSDLSIWSRSLFLSHTERYVHIRLPFVSVARSRRKEKEKCQISVFVACSRAYLTHMYTYVCACVYINIHIYTCMYSFGASRIWGPWKLANGTLPPIRVVLSPVRRSTRQRHVQTISDFPFFSLFSLFFKYVSTSQRPLSSFLFFFGIVRKCTYLCASRFFVMLIVECMLPMALPNFVVVGDCQSSEISRNANPTLTRTFAPTTLVITFFLSRLPFPQPETDRQSTR